MEAALMWGIFFCWLGLVPFQIIMTEFFCVPAYEQTDILNKQIESEHSTQVHSPKCLSGFCIADIEEAIYSWINAKQRNRTVSFFPAVKSSCFYCIVQFVGQDKGLVENFVFCLLTN